VGKGIHGGQGLVIKWQWRLFTLAKGLGATGSFKCCLMAMAVAGDITLGKGLEQQAL